MDGPLDHVIYFCMQAYFKLMVKQRIILLQFYEQTTTKHTMWAIDVIKDWIQGLKGGEATVANLPFFGVIGKAPGLLTLLLVRNCRGAW